MEGSPIPLLVAGTSIPAGYPSPAQDYFSGEINLSDYLIHDKTSTFIVRVSGHSMQGAGISDGDELIVNRARKPVDGSIVVAILDGEMTVKRLRLAPQGVVLQAENSEYPDIVVGEWGALSVWAVAETCIHRL
ncbi:translesion error-prone DNA polymerase V autoproteolytic subunit [Paeniglutamicibacter sulfureus]|uniref:LexA family protein n=1 Tax=Paeniglutamicibacter sulfureus TaxID=43666 RepID=UPI002666A378|nr:translesion error-prone DNA polymerase V autoproteolytic subunit [Paeniglutamicibacter sulfureus]MDO2934108.1 translesion error-prone DNA polymerase V autoproteolytic subunit [Paeniglutamicibacter sulfureus]